MHSSAETNVNLSAETKFFKIEISHPVTWTEAKKMADKQGSGLLTLEEFKIYSLKAG